MGRRRKWEGGEREGDEERRGGAGKEKEERVERGGERRPNFRVFRTDAQTPP
jgi:hypothetical protein